MFTVSAAACSFCKTAVSTCLIRGAAFRYRHTAFDSSTFRVRRFLAAQPKLSSSLHLQSARSLNSGSSFAAVQHLADECDNSDLLPFLGARVCFLKDTHTVVLGLKKREARCGMKTQRVTLSMETDGRPAATTNTRAARVKNPPQDQTSAPKY